MAELRAGRPVAQVVLVFLLAVIIGRLMLERTGVGQALLFVAIPLAFFLLAARYGIRPALLMLGIIVGLAWLVRGVLSLGGGGWLIVLMLPVVAAVLAIATHVTVTLMRERGRPAAAESRGEEEEE